MPGKAHTPEQIIHKLRQAEGETRRFRDTAPVPQPPAGTWDVKHESARHSGLAADYLLAPGSGIFAVALRTSRRTETSAWLDAGFDLFPVLGGSYLDAVLQGQG